jgi:hypothetical protein
MVVAGAHRVGRRERRPGAAAVTGLLVMVPTRGRRAQCERLLQSYQDTVTLAGTEMVFISDGDDQDTYEGMGWEPATHAVIGPRLPFSGKLNSVAAVAAGGYDVLMWVGNDHVFRTPGWDGIMLAALHDMGGSGWVYPDDRRRADVPEIWMCSSDVVRALGWFANPSCSHYYTDNSVAELGRRAGLIRYCPQAVIEHLHYSVCKDTEYDALYKEAEETWGQSDLAAFRQWMTDTMPYEVARLRRQFSPDVAWVLGKVA